VITKAAFDSPDPVWSWKASISFEQANLPYQEKTLAMPLTIFSIPQSSVNFGQFHSVWIE
jgi:hypothetical protein